MCDGRFGFEDQHCCTQSNGFYRARKYITIFPFHLTFPGRLGANFHNKIADVCPCRIGLALAFPVFECVQNGNVYKSVFHPAPKTPKFGCCAMDQLTELRYRIVADLRAAFYQKLFL